MAQSHRMNDGLSLLMVQGNSAMAISTRNYHHHSRTWREEKRKKQKIVSTIYLMHDVFNVWSNLWNITRNKK